MSSPRHKKYQKSLPFNHLLPYSEHIDSEGDELFEDIKTNLSIAIQKRELWPGTLFWTNRLDSFLKIYGFHFSKEDHVKLLKLFFEIVTIPNLESPLLHSWCSLLVKLLKRRKILSPDDVRFPWRPMYDLLLRVCNSKMKRLGMKVYSDHTINSVRKLISHLRCYFEVGSTQEMLDEWRPLLCPFDTAMIDAMDFFDLFLPTLVYPDQFSQSHELWFSELLHLWLGSRNNSQIDEHCMKLFSRLAHDTVGHIDWTPYLSQIFTRILNSFELPMGIKEFQAPQNKKMSNMINGEEIASFIVDLLGGDSPAQDYLTKLMNSFESYYHPSNIGFHSKKLLKFLENLTSKFVLRLKRERHAEPSWIPQVPKQKRLSEEDIDKFVQCLLPSVWLAIFSKLGTFSTAAAIQNLTLVRPGLVLPTLMEKTYTALETLTEPHQVVSTLSCATVVSRSLLSKDYYPEGRSHLFMLLKLAIPGIDPNDFRKMLVSSLLISSLTTLVPLVDCSTAIGHVEMDDYEIELCSQTSQFEEFVDCLLERCFLVIEKSGTDHSAAELVSEMKQDSHETILGAGLAGLVFSVLNQCSPQIFQIALDKLFRFASSHVFDSEIASKMCVEMCGAAAKRYPSATFKKFLPHCTSIIENILEDPDQYDSEKPDVELIFNIQLLSCFFDAEGSTLLPHSDVILNCLKKCILIKNKKATKHTAKIILSLLSSLTQTYPIESHITNQPLDLDPKEHLYIRDWAKSCPLKDTDIRWHTPVEEEYQLVDRILYEILQPQLNKLSSFIEDTSTMDRDSLLRCLDIVSAVIQGVSAYLPGITGPPLNGGCPESVVPLERRIYLISVSNHSPPSEFSRQKLSEFFHKLKVCLMEKCEDDTKSLITLTNILKYLLVNFGTESKEIEARWQSFKQSKSAMENNKLHGKKMSLRPITIARVQLQHEMRMMERNMSIVTSTHMTLIEDLIDLSVSTYPQIRLLAQQAVAAAADIYIFAARRSLPKIVQNLKNTPDSSHGQFKGSLYLLLTPAVTAAIVHDWQLMRDVLPVVVQADHSEKPSILNLISHLHNAIQKSYDTFAITFEVTDSCLPLAAALHSPLPPEDIKAGVEKLKETNQISSRAYSNLIEDLVAITIGQQDLTQWRFTEISVKLLTMLIRHDHQYPLSGVQLFVNCLNHDVLAIRKVAIYAVTLLLQQLKRPLKKIPMDIKKLAGIEDPTKVIPGEREDNKWLCLNEDLIENEETWNSNYGIVNKTRYGYYCYPVTLYGYAPMDEQPKLNRSSEEMSEAEQIIFKAFTDPNFVEKLITFLSLEDVKGSDKYNVKRAQMFKNLFRNYANSLVPYFRPHLEKLAVDTQESSQRCACEIIAGLVRSTNHWSYDMISDLRSWLEPLLRKVIKTIQQETADDWMQCLSDISADRDPKRIRWLLQLLMENPLSGGNGSFIDSCHLSLLHMALAQQEWRVPTLIKRLSDYVSTQLDHSFKNVREKLGMVISGLYIIDVRPLGFQMVYNPQLTELVELFKDKIPSGEDLVSQSPDSPVLKICKTAMCVVVNSYQPSSFEYYQLLSMLIPLAAYEGDDEIGFLVKAMCIQLSRRELSPKSISLVLDTIKKVISSSLWKAKLLVLLVLQVLVFWNFFTFASVEQELVDVLLLLMEDVQVEVREIASSTISGLVQCGFIPVEHLKSLFMKNSKAKLVRGQQPANGNLQEIKVGGNLAGSESRLIKRHSGVLGLAALVQACPYSVPDWLPEVIDELSSHLHDPAPIPTTVKKAMTNFKRTHYDNWREHKLKFTEDQLSSLSDLLLSPSYYA